MRGRRRRHRPRGNTCKGRRGRARPEKVIDVRVERCPNSREKPAKVRRIRRCNGDVTEERDEL
jgi:hypothetical protein